MGRIRSLKGHEQVFDQLARVRSNSLTISSYLYVAWILEEGCGGSLFEGRSQKSNFLGVRFEHRIRKPALFSLYERMIQRILLEKLFDFCQSVQFRIIGTDLSLLSFLKISSLDIKFDKLAVGELLVRFQVHILHFLTNFELLFD